MNDPEHPKPGQPELFLRTPFAEWEPAFSPDGRWMAYGSTESGRSEVLVRPFPGGGLSGSGLWKISTDGGQSPIWSRDGTELFYQGPDNRIQVATYTANEGSFAPGKPRPWSKTQVLQPLDLAPDGKRFVAGASPDDVSAGDSKRSVHLTFLLNFFDEVHRRIPTLK